MPPRRILSLWFPRLPADRWQRLARGRLAGPLAVAAEAGQRQVVAAVSAEAAAAGIAPGQPLRDALAQCPALVTRPADPPAEAAFLRGLRRWAGRFSPWVAEAPPDGLTIDVTGCAPLFGGEAALLALAEADCAAMGVAVQGAIADTPGAAWALARFAGRAAALGPAARSGDAIDQEARATRARAARRPRAVAGAGARAADAVAHAVPAGAGQDAAPHPGAPPGASAAAPRGRIVPPGGARAALAPLPVAALRLPPATVEALARVGLRRIGDLLTPARAPLARRFGQDLLRRLDQALGLAPEPVSPAAADMPFAVRLTLPEPIGLESDLAAGLARLCERLCARLAAAGRGARRLRLEAQRTDRGLQVIEVGLARPAAEPARILPLFAARLGTIEAGFGIDRLRLEAVLTEPVHPVQHRGHLDAAAAAAARGAAGPELADLIGRIGARIGLEAITRWEPADSHLPEKAARVLAAAFAPPPAPGPWPVPPRPRPLLVFRPEPVAAPDDPAPPARFRWRGRAHVTEGAAGPERIAPEWWLDAPDWRTGPRDYWRIETEAGERLWLFYAHGGALPGGWFCQGLFA